MPGPSEVNTVEKLTSRAIAYLSFRPRSVQEVTRFVFDKSGHNQTLTDVVMLKLQQFNLLNDVEFTLNWVDFRLRQFKGPILIIAELKYKGINHDLINQTINQVSRDDWKQAAANYLKKKNIMPKIITPPIKSKIYRLLTARGFYANTIYTVIDEIRSQ